MPAPRSTIDRRAVAPPVWIVVLALATAGGAAERFAAAPPGVSIPSSAQGSAIAEGRRAGDALQTDIFADEEAQFDSKTRSGVFRGNVRVEDPEFTITCDVLTVYLNKEENGLREAVATGNVTIVQHKSNARRVSGEKPPPPAAVGKGAKLVYETASGTAQLSGWPQVQQGINLIKAAEPGTVMVFTRGGKMTTRGRTKTEIRQQQ